MNLDLPQIRLPAAFEAMALGESALEGAASLELASALEGAVPLELASADVVSVTVGEITVPEDAGCALVSPAATTAALPVGAWRAGSEHAAAEIASAKAATAARRVRRETSHPSRGETAHPSWGASPLGTTECKRIVLTSLTRNFVALYSGRAVQPSPSLERNKNARRSVDSSRLLLGSVVSVGLLAAALSGGCAKGNTLTGAGGSGATGGPGSGAGTNSGGAGAEGPVGAPCETKQDCPDGGECVQVGNKKICTVACPPACPGDTYCTLIEGDSYCVPNLDQQCTQCAGSAQCKGITDECLTAPAGDKFCARDCTTMADCPTGFECVERTDYLGLGTGAGGDGGGGGAGGGTATTSSTTSTSSTTTTATGTTGSTTTTTTTTSSSTFPAGIPHRYCVPTGAASCVCNEKRDGVTKSCAIKNEFGTCDGSESCDGDKATWVGCTAKTPSAETCNTTDDDCNGSADEADPNSMCGGAPPHATWACNTGMCSLAACDMGWTQYPVGPAAAGCTCAVDASEPNDSCASPANAGSVTDAGGPAQITGTLSSDTDVDVWMFDAVDTDEVITNSYNVAIVLAQDEGSENVILDVIRGDTCTDSPTGAGSNITSYGWCVNGKSTDGLKGEAPCGEQEPVHCNNHTSKYFIRVRRKGGAPAVCTPYKISITAHGMDPCDMTQNCQ